MSRSLRLLVACLSLLSSAAFPEDFWAHWGDGRAELNGYRLVQPRYSAERAGTAVLVFVTEDMSDALRVKADPGKHPASDVFHVMKLNAIRDFQTGIYDYNVMTSTFARIAPGWPVAKLSFSSQEWCGNVYHQLLVRGGRIAGAFHSYFDGEADGTDDLSLPAGGVFEDAVPILLRGWGMYEQGPGESRVVPFLPSLLRARLGHRSLAWGKATITRERALATAKVPAGTFQAVTWVVAEEGGPKATYLIEAAWPHRLVRWSLDTGEEAELLGSARLAYWKMNAPGDERHLKELGLGAK